MTDFWRRVRGPLLVRTGYLIAGVKIGALWLVSGDSSLWAHALKLLALMAVVMTVVAAVRWRQERRGQHVSRHPVGRFLFLKLALVAVAVIAAFTLGHWIPNIDVWVGLGLGAVVTVLGPVIHPWLVKTDKAVTDDAAPASFATCERTSH